MNLTVATVATAWPQSVWPQDTWDLSALATLDSAGVALLVNWATLRRAAGISPVLVNPPAHFIELATLYGVMALFTLSSEASPSSRNDHVT